MLIIDSHIHVHFNGLSPDDLVERMDRDGVDHCWALTWEETEPNPHGSYQHLSVEDAVAASKRHPGRFVPMYAPDPGGGDPAVALAPWLGHGVRGVGELKVRMGWDEPGIRSILETARAFHLPVVFHMQRGARAFDTTGASGFNALLGRLWLRNVGATNAVLAFALRIWGEAQRRCSVTPDYLADFAALEARLKEYPDVDFVAHGPWFWKNIAEDLSGPTYPDNPVAQEGVICRLLRQYANLHCDLSGQSGYSAMARDHLFALRFLSEHQHKVLYGTDNCDLGLQTLLDGLGLPDQARRRIFGENALELESRAGRPRGNRP